VDGERLTQHEILGFFQLLVVAGQDTTSSLITNTMLCLFDNPDQFARLKKQPELLASVIEEDAALSLAVSMAHAHAEKADRTPGPDSETGRVDPRHGRISQPRPKTIYATGPFRYRRNPNPHIAFGHGIIPASVPRLSRVEARIALGTSSNGFRLSSAPAMNRGNPEALHVHGPTTCRSILMERGSPAASPAPK
jgi:cytochrome P450